MKFRQRGASLLTPLRRLATLARMPFVDQNHSMVQNYLEIAGLKEGFISPIDHADEMFQVLIRVMGNAQDQGIVSYFETGRQLLRTVENVLEQSGRKLSSLDRVLEVACGYGRLTRHLIREIPAERIQVTDIQRDAVEFQAKMFGTDAILSGTEPDAVPLTGPFDLIVVVSLFSHLPLVRFQQWLTRLHGLLSPDGILLFTVHPQEGVTESERDASGFTFKPIRDETNAIASADVEQDRQEYGSTYVTPSATRRIAAECGIEHVYHCGLDLHGYQDVYAMSPSAIPALEAWKPTRMVEGHIDSAIELVPDTLYVGGWCIDSRRREPIKRLRVWMNGRELIGETVLGERRPDVARVQRDLDYLHTGWSVTAPMPADRSGSKVLIAEADGMVFHWVWGEISRG